MKTYFIPSPQSNDPIETKQTKTRKKRKKLWVLKARKGPIRRDIFEVDNPKLLTPRQQILYAQKFSQPQKHSIEKQDNNVHIPKKKSNVSAKKKDKSDSKREQINAISSQASPSQILDKKKRLGLGRLHFTNPQIDLCITKQTDEDSSNFSIEIKSTEIINVFDQTTIDTQTRTSPTMFTKDKKTITQESYPLQKNEGNCKLTNIGTALDINLYKFYLDRYNKHSCFYKNIIYMEMKKWENEDRENKTLSAARQSYMMISCLKCCKMHN